MGTTNIDWYGALLRHAPVLPGELLRGAYLSAQADGDLDLLSKLAARADVPPDVLAELAASRAPRVVAAIRARPTRPDRPAARAIEQRASVLARAIGGYRTPDGAAFADAINQYVAKPSVTLLKVLTTFSATWFTPEQAAALLRGIDAGPAPDAHEKVHDLAARLGPDLGSQTLLALTNDLWIGTLLRFPLPLPALEAAANAAVDRHALTQAHSGSFADLLARAFAQADRVDPQMASRVMGRTLAVAPQLLGHVTRATEASHLQRYGPSSLSHWDLTPASPPRPAQSFDDATADVLAAAATSDDATVLHQVVERVTSSGDHQLVEAVSCVLLHNRHVRDKDVYALLDSLIEERGHYHPDRLQDLAKLDVIALRGHDHRVVAAWASLCPAQVLRQHGWKPFGGQEVAVEQIMVWLRQYADRGPTALRTLLEAAASAGLTDSGLLALPLAVLRVMASPAVKDEHGLAVRVACLISDRLGAQTGRWAVFNALAPTFTGTLGELLKATCAVHD